MNSLTLTGCCSSSYLYNLGGAHYHQTAINQEEFDKLVKQYLNNSLGVCITNHQQGKTREYLRKQGWKEEKVNGLYVHTISKSKFMQYWSNRPGKKPKDPNAPRRRPYERHVGDVVDYGVWGRQRYTVTHVFRHGDSHYRDEVNIRRGLITNNVLARETELVTKAEAL